MNWYGFWLVVHFCADNQEPALLLTQLLTMTTTHSFPSLLCKIETALLLATLWSVENELVVWWSWELLVSKRLEKEVGVWSPERALAAGGSKEELLVVVWIEARETAAPFSRLESVQRLVWSGSPSKVVESGSVWLSWSMSTKLQVFLLA